MLFSFPNQLNQRRLSFIRKKFTILFSSFFSPPLFSNLLNKKLLFANITQEFRNKKSTNYQMLKVFKNIKSWKEKFTKKKKIMCNFCFKINRIQEYPIDLFFFPHLFSSSSLKSILYYFYDYFNGHYH